MKIRRNLLPQYFVRTCGTAWKSTVERLLIFLLVVGAGTAWAANPAPSMTMLAITSAGGGVTTVASPAVVTLTATVTAAGSAVTRGVVNFCYSSQPSCYGGALAGTAQLTSAGTAAISFQPAVGNHSYKAVFAGTTSAQTSMSAASMLSVTQGTTPVRPTTTTITSSGTAGSYTLTGFVLADTLGVPSGTLNFVDLTNGKAIVGSGTLSTPTVAPGFLTVPATTDFQNATPLAAGDFNGDGIADLITALSDGTVVSQLGNGDGSFTTKETITGAGGQVAVGDFNSDGKLDIATSANGAVSIYLGDGTGNFTAVTTGAAISANVVSMAVADFNQDGIPDLALMDYETAYIYLGNGDGTFTAGYTNMIVSDNEGEIFPGPSGIATGDFNGDGLTDVAMVWQIVGESVGGDSSFYVTFLFGDGTGNFSPTVVTIPPDMPDEIFGSDPLYGGPPGSMVMAASDINGDGKPDLTVSFSTYVCCPGGQVTNSYNVLNNGGGAFTVNNTDVNLFLGPPLASAAIDLNGDGTTQIATRWDLSQPGPGMLGPPTHIDYGGGSLTLPNGVGSGFVTGDFNGDGIPDIAIGGPITTSLVGFQTTTTATAEHVAVSPAGSGMHQVEASYAGDATHSASVSTPVSLDSGLATPTITLTVPSVAFGSAAVITATMASGGAVPTGTVTFLNGTTNAGSAPLSSGVATFSLNNLMPGTYSITASYPGDANNVAVTSAAASLTVTTQAPTLTLTTPTTTTTYGSSLTLTATIKVTGTVPSGSIMFKNGSAMLGSQALDANGIASLTVPAPGLPAGSDSVTASFAGNGDYAAVTSAPLVITVSKDMSVLTLTPSAATITVGASETFVATLPTADSAGSGTVTFYLGSVSLGSGAVSGGSAKLTTSALPVGMDSVTATWSGDNSFNGATSAAVVVMVAPVLTLTSASGTIYAGVSDSIKVTVGMGANGAVPTGTITLSSGSYTSAPVTLSAGSATIVIPANTLPAGNDTVVASYSGDAIFPAASGGIVVAVSTDPVPGFTISVQSVTIVAGATANNKVPVTLNPVTGFTGSVDLTAQVTSSPANAHDPPTVSFGTSNSVMITGNSAVTATLTVTTTASTTAHNEPTGIPNRMKWLTSGGAVLACVVIVGIPGRRSWLSRVRRNLSMLAVFFAALVTVLTACGGGTHSMSTTTPGTTPGAYTITVTGKSGSVSSTGMATVTVQ